ncbi:MAG: hypothetical protein LBO74_17755 [Candidatus Symbiothrix sp.]|jgi:hypothetical protein|nr:hypothetical protein [Candidatus Symbiothrix sp.]
MKKILSLVLVMGLIYSCSNNETAEIETKKEQQNEFFILMQDRFEEVGVVNMIDNYQLKANDIEAINKFSTILKDHASLKFAIHKISYDDGSIVYAFEMSNKSLNVIKINQENEVVRNFTCQTKQIQGKDFIFANEKGIESSVAVENLMSKNRLRGNCDELGYKRLGETFNSCFERNWNNFCCDVFGCIAQIAAPWAVASAIALVCIC